MPRISLLLFFPFLLACGHEKNPPPAKQNTGTPAVNEIGSCEGSEDELPVYYSCKDLDNVPLMISHAREEAGSVDDAFLLNGDIDTASVHTWEDYFTRSDKKNKLVYVPVIRNSVMSSSNVLMLFECRNDSALLLQTVSADDFENMADLDNDGVMELIFTGEYLHMGTDNQYTRILHFKGGKMKLLYAVNSYTTIDAGLDEDLQTNFREGDTLADLVHLSFTDSDGDGAKEIREEHTYSIHNGGKNYADFLKRILEKRDTVLVNLRETD